MGTLEKPSGTCSLALSGKFPISIGLKVSDETFFKSWVIDLGATNHMTHSLHQFKNYNPCPSSRKIGIIDGSLTTIAGIGDVQISPILKEMCSMFQSCPLILFVYKSLHKIWVVL